MSCLGSRGMWTSAAFTATLWLTVSPTASCSVLLDHDAKQCKEDRDCTRFPDAVCNSNAGICIGRPSFSTPGDGSADKSPGTPRDGGPPGSEASVVDSAGEVHGGPVAVPGSDAGLGMTANRCPDLNANGVFDCVESVAINADFKTGVEGWTPELDMRQGFSVVDGQGAAGSGSMVVVNASQSEATTGWTMGGSKQCVRTAGATSYELYVQTQFAAPSDIVASAGAVVQFYAAADCAGSANGSFMAQPVDGLANGWRVAQGIVPVPLGTQSLLIRLVVIKPFKQPAMMALFDNVLLKVR